jgi:hypothetical protein
MMPGYGNKPKGTFDIAYKLRWIETNRRNSEANLVSWQGAIIREPDVGAPPSDQPQEPRCNETKPAK